MKFRIGNTALVITPMAALLLSTVLYTHTPSFTAALFLACAVHETGHLLAAAMLKERIDSVFAGVRGLCIKECGAVSEYERLFIILSGPASGLLLSFLCFVNIEYCRLIGSISLRLSLFNLIPALPLDGGNALNCAIGLLFDARKGERAAKIASKVVIYSMCFAGGVFLCLDKGAFPLFFGLYLIYFNMLEEDL